MKVTEEGWRQPKYCLHFVRWYQSQIIADSFTTWRTVFIKQAPFSTHRTLYKTFGARRPSSVFFGNRFRSADCQKIQLPPGGSQGSRYVFARDFIKTRVPTAKPLSQAPWACQLPFQGRFSRCPLWGWCSAQRIRIAMIAGGNHTLVSCRDSGKGGVVGNFELLPFNR